MSDRVLKITRLSPRKFSVLLPGGGHSGELTEAEARGFAMGFARGVGWAASQMPRIDGIVGPE